MTIQLYANNAKTTLASPINATQTTITVAPGTGSLFPNPSSGQVFVITLVSASSSSVYEICLCTSRSIDILTVVRAQEGTTGTPFSLSDIVGNFDTAGVMNALVQSNQLQNQYYLFGVSGGTANSLTATIPSSLTALTDGMSIIVKAGYANTGASTLNLTLGTTATGVLPIVSGNNTALIGGEIPSSGYPVTLTYSSTYNAWVITNGNINLNAYALINSQTFTGTPRVPSAPFNDATTIIANTSWVQGQLANYAPIFNPTLTGIPRAPTASTSTNTTQIATTAFVKNSILADVIGLGFGGTSWHNVTGSRSVGVTYTNPYNYPIMVAIYAPQGPDVYVNGVYIGSNSFATGDQTTITFIVPAGATYLTVNASVIINWAELY